ncbi:hypothetical protein VNI00_007118 [Paramarasmius palmivorus]|uniref:Protein kinase domain-containing protein n=1 Tax=Paramarasmius palmivorus TaxID=297713 RepID=A0AAW0D137_9AGAR
MSEDTPIPSDSNGPRIIQMKDIAPSKRSLSQESISSPTYILKGIWNGRSVIVKKLTQDSRGDQLAQKASTWRGLYHPNILDVYGISAQDEEPLYIILPLQQNGSVRQWIAGRSDQNLNPLVLDVAVGMRYLHANGIVHGGLKPDNILINADGRACVADYDMAHIQPSRSLDSHRYFSPEAWKGTTSKESDVFAFAMCALEILTLALPWGFHSEKRIYRLLVQENARPDRPDDPAVIRRGLTDKVWSIIEECWCREARLRPSFDIIVRLWREPDEESYSATALTHNAGDQRSSPNAALFDNRDRAGSASGSGRRREVGNSVGTYLSGPPAYNESEELDDLEVTEPSPGYADYATVTSARNAPSDDLQENEIVYTSPAQAHNMLVRGMSSGESSSSVGTSSSRGWRGPPRSPPTPATPPSSRSLKKSSNGYAASPQMSPSRSLPVTQSHSYQQSISGLTGQTRHSTLRTHRFSTDLVEALPVLTRDETLRRWEANQQTYSPQPSTSVHRQYISHQLTAEPLEMSGDMASVDESLEYSFRMGSQSSSRSTVGAHPSAMLLVQALQAEVKEGRNTQSVDGFLHKMYEVAMESEKEAFKLVHAGAVPTLIHLLKTRAAEQYGVEIVLITLGTLAHHSISANAIYRTGTATTLVELCNSTPEDSVRMLSIWCLTRICRSTEVANSLIKLNLVSVIMRFQASIGPIMPTMPLYCLGTLIQSDALAEHLASLGLVKAIATHLKRCSQLDVPSPDSVSAGLYAVARISRSIPLAKELAKAGCVEVIARHLKTSTDPDVLHWSARAVGCLMRPNSSDMSKILLEADIARGLARLPTVLPPGSLYPLGSFGFAIQRFSCAEWGGSTRKALVEAGVVDSLLAALRVTADEFVPDVHVELALAISLLGDVGGSAIRKEIVNAGGIDILKNVGAAGGPDVSKACNMAVTSITGNLFSRNAGSSLDEISLTPRQAEIVSKSATAVQAAVADGSVHRVLSLDDCFVKFDNMDILNEGDTQVFVYTAFRSSPNAPRVPKVYECFSWNGMQYLVTERINHPTVDAWAIANALRSLFTLSAPIGSEIGLIEGAYAKAQSPKRRAKNGLVRHPFFGYDTAPFRYTGAPALQRHINKALTYRPRSAPPLEVNIADDPLVMVQDDIHPSNFLIDPETHEVTIIDFAGISALPRSFVSFTLYTTKDKFVAGVAQYLSWERFDSLLALAAAAGIYAQISNKRFGLDKDGHPVPKVVSR